MNNPTVSNPNDFKVVSFHNKEAFGFTPEMGCMYNGQGINGITGAPGVNAGESLTVPYHIGQQLAINLAKVALTRSAPAIDPAGIPTGVPLWDTVKLNNLKNSYLTELYTEARPMQITDADKMMAKLEEYKKMTEALTSKVDAIAQSKIETPVTTQTVIAELTKRGIKFDARQNKENLTKLLA